MVGGRNVPPSVAGQPRTVMKQFIFLAVAILFGTSAQAATVTGTIIDNSGTALNGGIIRFKPTSNPAVLNPNIAAGIQKSVTLSTNGTFSTALVQGNYQVTVNGNTWTISVPAGSGTYAIEDISSGTYTFPWSGLLKLSEEDTTPDYLTNKIFAGENITLTYTNAGGNEGLYISSDASGSGLTEAEASLLYQSTNTHLTDLSDGTLTGSKVGTGISADNITSGTLAEARAHSDLARDSEVTSAIATHAALTDTLLEVEAIFGVNLLTSTEGDAAYQPLDADLTSIAALSTTAFGRGLLDDADASAGRTSLGVAIGTDVQAYDADLAAFAGISAVQGDIIYHNGTQWTRLAKGTAGQVLEMNAGATAPEWDTDDSGGSSSNWSASGTTNSTLAGVAYVHEIVATNGITTSGGAFSMVIEGATADDFETTLTATDPTADNSINFPNASGTIIVSGHTFTGDVTATVDSDGSTALVIADSVTVTGWALGASTATTPGADDSDTSVATTAFVQGEINGDTRIYEFALGDETTASTTGTGKVTWRAPHAMTVTAVRASVTTAPTGSTLIVDINESGTTILSTKLSIDASEKTSTTAASAAVISDTAIADDAEITFDLDQVGSTVAGAGVKVKIYYTK